jgi:hypothetical protein
MSGRRAASSEALGDDEADPSEEEWTCLRRAPIVAGMAISM